MKPLVINVCGTYPQENPRARDSATLDDFLPWQAPRRLSNEGRQRDTRVTAVPRETHDDSWLDLVAIAIMTPFILRYGTRLPLPGSPTEQAVADSSHDKGLRAAGSGHHGRYRTKITEVRVETTDDE